MRLYAVLPAVIALLQREKRVTYWALKHDFDFDDRFLALIRDELIFKELARDEQGKGLVWVGERSPQVQSGVRIEQLEVSTTPPTINVVEPPTLPPLATNRENPNGMPASPPLPVGELPSVKPVLPSADQRGTSPQHEPVAPFDDPSSTAEIIPSKDGLPQNHPNATPERSVPEAERRQLTVMFCDLVGSTDLSGQLDPEDLRGVIRAYQETASEVIERYEGHVAQYLGDGLLIYFGFPVAHENDAQRAVYTGLGIPEAMATLNKRLEAEYGIQLAVRIGIHTGSVVVGEMGSGGRLENLALGETPNIAARIEGLASPNSAVISPVTAQLVQQTFALEELGPYTLKGISEPMTLFRVVRPETWDQDNEGGLIRGFDTLVGRDEEIGLLLRRWEQSKGGLGQVVLLSGEAGIGKSSLVEGLRDHVRQEGLTRIAFRCSPYHTNSALYPIIEYVQNALGWETEDTTDIALTKLEQGLQRTSLPLEEAVPLLASLLSLPLPKGRYPTITLSPDQQRQQTQDILVAWLLEKAENQAVLAVWEDLHWSDPSTLEVLKLIVDQAPTATMLNVMTFRPEFELPWPMRSHLTPITLNRLERPQVEGLVVRLAGDKTMPTEVVEHIVSKTDGVPLYVEELTKMLLESQLLSEEADQYVLMGPLLSVSIPDTLQDSLMARLDQMNTAKEVAQQGAVLGREFSYAMIQAISSQDEETLQSGLARLAAAELLYQRGRPPRAKYIFKHALIQDAAYQSLLRSTRQHYHDQIAHVLESNFPETVEIQPELVAYHYTEASQYEPAIAYWLQAGQLAQNRSAHHEAVAHLRQGIELLPHLPETLERSRKELILYVTLGSSLYTVKGFAEPEVEQVHQRARVLCQQLGDTQNIFPVLRGLVLFEVNRRSFQSAEALASDLLELAERQSNLDAQMLGHYSLSIALVVRGNVKDAKYHGEYVIATHQPQDHHALIDTYGIDLGVAARSFMSLALWQLGYPDQALQHGLNAVSLAKQSGHPFSLMTAQTWLAWLYHFRREPVPSHTIVTAGNQLAEEQGFALYAAFNRMWQGWALTSQGHVAEGIEVMRESMTSTLGMGTELMHPYHLAIIADVLEQQGDWDEGADLISEALTLVNTIEGYWWEPELHRLRGELLLRQSEEPTSQARDCFSLALEIAGSRHAKSLELRAAMSMARLYQQEDRLKEAHEVLVPAYDWFTEGFDTEDIISAGKLIEFYRSSGTV